MGFPAGRIEAALKNTDGSLEQSIEWLEVHQNQSDRENDNTEEPSISVEDDTNTASLTETQEAELKPLTQAEKDAKLDALRAKAAERKRAQEKIYKEDSKKNELIRRKRDQESARAFEEIQHKEALKEAERKRKQVKEDALAKQRIRERIEADKEARRRQRLANDGHSQPAAQPAPKPASAPVVRAAPTESRLRFRVQGQPPNAGFMKTFPVATTLGELAKDISTEVGIAVENIAFQTTFPTATFDKSSFEKTLKETGLVNANVIVKQV